MRVWFVLDDENNVSRNGTGRLVSLSWECDLGSLFPAPLDLDGENLVLSAHGPAVWIQPFARYLHPLGAAVEDLLQGDPQFVDDGWVLLATLLPSKAGVAVTGESVQVEAGEGAKGVVSIHLHVIIISPVGFATEEHLKRVRTPKESGKGGVRVPVEGVGERVARSVTSGSISSLET